MNIDQTISYSGANGTGTVESLSETYNVQPAAANNGQAQTYAQIAASLNMAGVTGTVLAAMNQAVGVSYVHSVSSTGLPVIPVSSGDAVAPEQATVLVPLASTGPQPLQVESSTSTPIYNLPAVTAAEQAAGVSYAAVVNIGDATVTFLALPSSDDMANEVFVVDGGDNLLANYYDPSFSAGEPGSGSSFFLAPNSLYTAPGTNTGTGGSGSGTGTGGDDGSGDGSGSGTGGTGNTPQPSYPNMPQYYIDGYLPANAYAGANDGNGNAINPPAGDYIVGNFLAPGPATTSYFSINGGSGSLQGFGTVVFNSSSATPDAAWNIAAIDGGNGNTSVTIGGAAGSGFSGTATLTDVNAVELGGTTYYLIPLPAGENVSGTLSADGGAVPRDDILAESAGTSNALTMDYAGATYWHINGTNDQIALQAGDSQFYLADAAADYTTSWNAAAGMLTVSETSGASNGGAQGVPQTGATSFILSQDQGGTGEINFADGSVLGLGDTGDAVEYLGPQGAASLDGDGNQALYGDQSSASFTYGESAPDSTWNIQQAALDTPAMGLYMMAKIAGQQAFRCA